MRKVVLLFLVLITVSNFFILNRVDAYTIDSINPIAEIGIPQGDFIGSATLAEVNFFESYYDTRYIFPMQGMAVTEDGLIAVIDNAYGRIHILSPLLQEKYSFGSLKEFTYPTDVAFANNNFYITDPFRKEIRIYEKSGIFMKSIKNSSFTSPIGVTVVSNYIFVSDYFSNTLFKLDSNGKILSSINIATPLGLSSNTKGNIFAISGKEKKIYVFDLDLNLVKAFGDDVLTFPSDSATDSKGYLYVVDRGLNPNSSSNPKIFVFDTNYKLVNSFGSLSNSTSSIPDGAFLTPAGIAVSSTNSLYVFDSGYFFYLQSNSDAPFGYPLITRLSVFNTSGYFVRKKDFVRDSSKGILLNPVGATLDENGYTWVLNRGNLDQSEILKFGSDGTLILRITKIGSQSLPSLTSIYPDKRGNILAIGNNQILVFSSTGAFKQNILNANFGLLKKILLFNGYYWVTSQDNGQVLKLDSNFKIVGSFSVCKFPSGIAFDSKGKAFITSLDDNMVHVYDSTFKELMKFGGSGKGNFKLYIPEDLDIDKDDNVYIANTENGKITVFTNNGAPLFETEPNYPGITSIEIENSHIIASDAFHNVVWIFEVKKQYLDYSFSVSSFPEEASISHSDFVNIYFTVTNTGLKTDSYTYSVSLTNANSFKYTIFDSSNTFLLLPNTSKRVRVLVESKDAKDGDSTQVIFKVTSSNLKYSMISNSIISVTSNLQPGIFIDEGSVQVGGNILLPLYIKNPSGIRGIAFDLIFDKNKVAFDSFKPESQFSNALILTKEIDNGITVMVEFPKENSLLNTSKIGYLSFKGLNIGSAVLQITDANYSAVTDEVKQFENIFPGGITVTPLLTVNIPDNFSTSVQTITITGNTTPGCTVYLNGMPVSVQSDGSFTYKLTLSSYQTNLIVVSKAKTGEETTIQKNIKFTGKLKLTIVLEVGNPIMYVNGVAEEIDPGRGTAPVIISGWNRTVVPIRAIVEKLGGSLGWDAVNKIVTININNKSISLQIGNNIAKVNGIEVPIDPSNPLVKPLIINDRTMVPLRFVAEQIGCTVSWDDKQKKIKIEYVFP